MQAASSSAAASPPEPMGFTDAVRVCFARTFDWSGRASRVEYWWFALYFCLLQLATVVLQFLAIGALEAFGADSHAGSLAEGTMFLPLLLLLAVHFLPWLAVGARRLHDISQPAWWLLLLWFNVFGWTALLVLHALPSKPVNKYGQPAPGSLP